MELGDIQSIQKIEEEEKQKKEESHNLGGRMFYLCLTGVQTHMVEKDLNKFFRKSFSNPILPLKGLLKKRGSNFAFLQFDDLEQKKDFTEMFNAEIQPQNKKLRLKEANKSFDPKVFTPVKTEEEMLKDSQVKKDKLQPTKEEIEEEMKQSVEERVTPYYKMAYPEQIEKKKEQLANVLKSFSSELSKNIKKRKEAEPGWFQELENKEIPCEYGGVIECDEGYINEYRNKVEFTIGRRYEDNEICVGFNKGNISKGIIYVDYPDNIKAISKESIQVAKIVEEFIRKSGVEPYDRIQNAGFWRILLFRESKRTKQVLITLVVTKQDIEQDFKTNLYKFLDENFSQGTKIGERGLFVQSLSVIYATELSGGYKEDDQLDLLSGTPSFEELLFGFKFQVSPFAFFQVNSNVFEKMLTLIEEFCGIDEETIVLDICCGTGAIGICLSSKAKKVIGIELIEQAIVNAKINVELNKEKIDPEKCEFYAGKAEDLLPSIVKELTGQKLKIIGIVDPPRSGLHQNVLKALRTCKGLDRLVYVSCNPYSQMKDIQYLCYEADKKRKGPAFKPLKCMGADLFPHTNHVESIIMFDRFYA